MAVRAKKKVDTFYSIDILGMSKIQSIKLNVSTGRFEVNGIEEKRYKYIENWIFETKKAINEGSGISPL